MATYTNNLRLKEIATGDESGTWGVTTNTNLDLIADSLGYNTQDCFSSDADAATTVADGSPDPARAMYFKVTSSVTLTDTRTLTIAPNTVSRVMFIENATTGSQSIAISQGSGANVTVANGSSKLVYLDGAGATAAVIDISTSLSLASTSGSFANLTVTSTGNFSGATISNLGTVTTADINGGTIDGTAIGSSSASTGNFSTLSIGGVAITSTAAELNILDGVTATTAELNYTDGVTSNIQTQLNAKAPIASPTFTGTTTIPTVDINGGSIDGTAIGSSSASTGNFSTLSIGGVAITSTAAELNKLDGVTATTTELNYTDGVTSNIQTQIDTLSTIPAVGTQTGSYTLTTADTGKYVQVGSGGSITIPNNTFSEGDVVNVFNNTTGDITITCSITTAYISGTDTDVATVTLATRGLCSIFFISGTVCVIAGAIS